MSFIALIDYGMGNLRSVEKALTASGGDVRLVRTPEEASGADRVVLPGVGNFGDGMVHLTSSGFVPFLRDWIGADRPFLGICLGMQMLMEHSEEAPGVPGLGVIPGEVVRFPSGSEKVPHIGWNTVERNPAGDGRFLPAGETLWFYFVHSYYVRPADPGTVSAFCRYILPFAASLTRGNLLAVQFHPEKSQDAGLGLLRSFLQKNNKGRAINKRRVKMILFPAIDLRGGKCVRLFQGDYAQETVYNDKPAQQALQWASAGAEFLHLVDLDGAREGAPVNLSAVRDICTAVNIPCELGGGIRTLDDAKRVFDAGVSRVILGTAVCEDPHIVESFTDKFGADRVVVGIDAKNGLAAVRGWVQTSEVSAFTLAKNLYLLGVNRIIYTDIATDGALKGPNFESVRSLCQLVPDCMIVASGGVSSTADIARFASFDLPNLEGVIVGKALYDGRVTLSELKRAAKGDEPHV